MLSIKSTAFRVMSPQSVAVASIAAPHSHYQLQKNICFQRLKPSLPPGDDDLDFPHISERELPLFIGQYATKAILLNHWHRLTRLERHLTAVGKCLLLTISGNFLLLID